MGAGTITITNAFFLGSILETLGSVFLSGEVNFVSLWLLSLLLLLLFCCGFVLVLLLLLLDFVVFLFSFLVFFFVLLRRKVFLCQVVATVAGPKSVINMELYKSNLTEELNKFVNNILWKLWDKNKMNGNKTSLRFQRNETTLLPERSLVLGLVTSMVGQKWNQMLFRK